MKIHFKQFVIFGVLSLAFVLTGSEVKRPLFTPVKVDFRLLNAPRFKSSGSTSSGFRSSFTAYNRRWGVVEISYKPHLNNNSRERASKRKEVNSGYWLDNVTCAIRVLARETQSRTSAPTALFSTRVDFWTISLNSAEHRYFVYLPPMLIERAMPLRNSNARVVKTAEAGNFAVSVIFYHKDWGVLGEGYCGVKGKNQRAVFEEFVRYVPKDSVFHGALLSRSQSPWGINHSDQFDLEKPASIPAPLSPGEIEKIAQVTSEMNNVGTQSNSKTSGSRKSKRNKK